MSYIIDACWEDSGPRLQILDASSGAVRLAWDPYREGDAHDPCRDCPDTDCPHRAAIQQLFRELFLLACGQRLIADACPGLDRSRCRAALLAACPRTEEPLPLASPRPRPAPEATPG